MHIRNRFLPYDNMGIGICVIEYEKTSPIIYCNNAFSSLISSQPNDLIGRSLDDLTPGGNKHYADMHPLMMRHTGIVELMGGFCIKLYDQIERKTPLSRTLKVWRVETELFDNKAYFVGFVRKATRLELWLNRLKLDTNLDPYLKPILTFMLAGHWRPYASVSSPFWMPWIYAHMPQLAEVAKLLIEP